MANIVSDVDIANRALLLIGAASITSLEEETREARLISAVFSTTRDEVLEASPWNFATHRAKLAKLAEVPAFGFSTAYQLPIDFLRLIRPNDRDQRFRLEGDQFLTDENGANIIYIRRITDPSRYSPLFIAAFASRMAAETMLSFNGDEQKRQGMMGIYQEHLSAAAFSDALQSEVEIMGGNDFTDARFRGAVSGTRLRSISHVDQPTS